MNNKILSMGMFKVTIVDMSDSYHGVLRSTNDDIEIFVTASTVEDVEKELKNELLSMFGKALDKKQIG